MPTQVVSIPLEKFQEQWGSIANACAAYWDGRMPDAQRWAFERLPNIAMWIYAERLDELLRQVVSTPA